MNKQQRGARLLCAWDREYIEALALMRPIRQVTEHPDTLLGHTLVQRQVQRNGGADGMRSNLRAKRLDLA